jgi:hypothetical protein
MVRVDVGKDVMILKLDNKTNQIYPIPSDKLEHWLVHNSIDKSDMRLMFDQGDSGFDVTFAIEFKYDMHAVTFRLSWNDFEP